ncbi:MAG: tetratricopeptide repeat protein [Candidatus Gastranaerophilales bacterium]|nr:tetratricopeptide repeat protein [Candidatus Gastranaerophilales bacterium]
MSLFEQVKKLISTKKYREAVDIFANLSQEEFTPEIKGLAGQCFYEMKNFDLAQDYLIDSLVEKYNNKNAKLLENILTSQNNNDALLGLKIMMHENNPKDIFILRDITELAQKIKNYDMAVQYFNVLLNKSPNDYVAWNNLGLVYEEINEWEKAENCYKKALSLKDFFSPNFNLGIISRKLHKFDDAIGYAQKAVKQNPESPQPKYSLGMTYLMMKDFEKGYPLYADHMTKIMPHYYKNEWDGEKHTDSSLCIFVPGGLGDMIMFARYLDYVRECFRKIYIILPKTLHKLFKNNYPFLEIIDSSEIFTDYDYAITPMHLLKIFNLDFNEFVPYTSGYMKADETLSEKFKQKFFNHNKIKIGINWHGNREGTRTFFNRSMPLECLEPVFEVFKDKAVFYSVQKDDAHTDCAKYPFIVDLFDEITDFNDTASIFENLDFLISIDSSPVHMAGAVGLPTYMLLPYANEWRWFINDTKSIWYDFVEIVRQDKEGDWDSAVQKLLINFKNFQKF